jgi:DMSO/TMAO reductase YedYZ molybdopterin-dependent catalytic subunit
MVVPEAYGFKSVKWLTHVVLTNLAYANDTYADADNDIDSPLKTFAATLTVPQDAKAGEAIAVSGYAQVGISGLAKVQVWVQPSGEEHPANDPNFVQAPWRDAEILTAPEQWGAVPEGSIPAETLGFDARGKPHSWPLRLCKVHWAAVLPGLPAGGYTLRCRSIDEKGAAQPMPRPMRKSGHAAIEAVGFKVHE